MLLIDPSISSITVAKALCGQLCPTSFIQAESHEIVVIMGQQLPIGRKKGPQRGLEGSMEVP